MGLGPEHGTSARRARDNGFPRRWQIGAGMIAVTAAIIAGSWLYLRSSGQATTVSTVTVGVYENAPKVYTDEQGRPAGLFITLIRVIARREHWSLRFVQCSWADCLKQLKAGDIDLMPDVAYSRARAKALYFPDHAVTYSWSQVYRNPDIQIRSIADLAGKKIAVLRDSIQQRYLARLMRGNKLDYQEVPVDTYAKGFDAVADGRAAAVVSNPFFGNLHVARYGLVETPIIFEPVGLYFATGKPEDIVLLHQIDRYLALWRDEPKSIYFTALREAMAPSPEMVVPYWVRVTLYTATTLAALLTLFILLLRWRVQRATRSLDRTNRQLQHVLDSSPVVLYQVRIADGRPVPTWVSPNIEHLFGFSPEQALDPEWWSSHLHPDDREGVTDRTAKLLEHGRVIQEYRIMDATGSVRHIRDELRLLQPDAGGEQEAVGTWSDLTEAREQAERLEYLTKFDPLTGLGNRHLLHEELAAAIRLAQQDAYQVAVLCVDLDRFKNINDTLGHNQGDELLHQVADELGALLDPGNVLARTGGDQFMIVVPLRQSVHNVTQLAQTIVDRFAQPVRFGDHELVVTLSIGVSLYPTDGIDADTLIKHAELALYQAKNSGRNTYRFFAQELSEGSLERLIMETSLRGAAARGELMLHYQPQIELRSGALVGVEALVRWNHPELGLVSPGHFIPLAEETGIIEDIGAWVLTEACRQMMEWRTNGFHVPSVAVNLSAQQIERTTLSKQVISILRETGLAAEHLELEITESTIMRHPDEAVDALAELKRLGVLLSIDDFGTGHSSLAYLKRLPIDRLKIDQSFVRDIGRDPDDEAISRTVIELARSLGLETVAEGVERQDQADFLHGEGCEFAQGYLFNRPLPAADLYTAWAGRVRPEEDSTA